MTDVVAISALPERLSAKIEVDDAGCWLWVGATFWNGYGQTSVNGCNRVAHRAIYEMLVEPVARELTLDHLCRVRHCVNPAHLEPVTLRENVLRGEGIAANWARRTHCPEGHPFSGDNLVLRSDGGRMCRICRRANSKARMRRWRARKKESMA